MRVYVRADEAAEALHSQAAEVYQMCKELEDLTKDTSMRYSALRVRVEAKAAFEQAKYLREAVDELGKRMRGES